MIYCSADAAAKNTLVQNYDSMRIDCFNGGMLSARTKTLRWIKSDMAECMNPSRCDATV